MDCGRFGKSPAGGILAIATIALGSSGAVGCVGHRAFGQSSLQPSGICKKHMCSQSGDEQGSIQDQVYPHSQYFSVLLMLIGHHGLLVEDVSALAREIKYHAPDGHKYYVEGTQCEPSQSFAATNSQSSMKNNLRKILQGHRI